MRIFRVCLDRPCEYQVNLTDLGSLVALPDTLANCWNDKALVLIALQQVELGGALEPENLSLSFNDDGTIEVREGDGVRWLFLVPEEMNLELARANKYERWKRFKDAMEASAAKLDGTLRKLAEM